MKKGLIVICLMIITLTAFFYGVEVRAERSVDIALNFTLRNMDPHTRYGRQAMATLNSIYERLVFFNAEGEYVPALATDWEQKDPHTWVFNLREGVKFHDGTSFTAKDVSFSYQRARTLTISELQFAANRIESIDIIDDYTIEITTINPEPVFLYYINRLPVMSEEWTKDRDQEYIANNANGTGPYQFVDWQSDIHLKMKAYEGYWGEKPEINEVTFRPIPEHSTRAAELLTNNADLISTTHEYVSGIASNDDLKIIEAPVGRIIYLGINAAEGPLSSQKVRQAMTTAINRASIVERVLGGMAVPTGQIINENFEGYNPEIEAPEFDPEGARDLLAEAGYPDGFELEFHFPSGHYIKDHETGLAVASYLEQIGISVNSRSRPWSALASDIGQQQVDFNMIGWVPSPIIAPFTGTILSRDDDKGHGAWNTGYSNNQVDDLFEQAVFAADEKERERLWMEANRLAMEEVAVIPLHQLYEVFGAHEDLNVTVGSGGEIYARYLSWNR